MRIHKQLFALMLIRIQLFTLRRIRILFRILLLLLIEVMGIYDHWSIDPPGLYLSLQASVLSVHGRHWLYFEPIQIFIFDFYADP